MKRVSFFYFLSGLVTLGYQVCWYRIFVDKFGSTNFTFVVVLCHFIVGLSLGAAYSSRVIDLVSRLFSVKDQLKKYGLMELLVSLSMILTIILIHVKLNFFEFPYYLSEGIYYQNFIYQLIKIASATACVFIPCFFMGVTFPYLCGCFHDRPTYPSALYAYNTAGACTGILLTQLFLLPSIGHVKSLYLMVTVNIFIGFIFVLMKTKPNSLRALVKAEKKLRKETYSNDYLLLMAGVSGLLTGALEADVLKRVDFVVSGNESIMAFTSFWAIAAIFLSSLTVRFYHKLNMNMIKILVVLGSIYYLIATRFPYAIKKTCLSQGVLMDVSQAIHLYPSLNFFFIVGIFLFPTFYLISFVLPFICNKGHEQKQKLDRVYAINTVAFCFGLVLFGYLIPFVNVFFSFKYFLVFLIVCVLYFVLIDRLLNKIYAISLGAVALVVLLSIFVSKKFDADIVMPENQAHGHVVKALKSNGSMTTYVMEDPGGDRLYFDNYSMSGATVAAKVYMRLMAHVPLLLQDDPRGALLICYGVGNTASAISMHDSIEYLDIVDLNENVFKTSNEFRHVNLDVIKDKRVTLINNDGRSYLDHCQKKYDLITSEPPPPLRPGVYRLYSKEYYQSVINKLTETGMMTQWLPLHQLPEEILILSIRTFVESFPHCFLYVGINDELILLGSLSPIDLEKINQNFSRRTQVELDCKRINIHTPTSLITRVLKTKSGLQELCGEGKLISDVRNQFSYVYLETLQDNSIDFDSGKLMNDPMYANLSNQDDIKTILSHLGLLQDYVNYFPLKSIDHIVDPKVSLSGIDWLEVEQFLVEFGKAYQAREFEKAKSILMKLLSYSDEQPSILMKLVNTYMQLHDYPAAGKILNQYKKLIPDSAVAQLFEGRLWIKENKLDEAIDVFTDLIDRDPLYAKAYFYLAVSYHLKGDHESAQNNYRLALQLDVTLTDAYNNLGLIYEAKKENDLAIKNYHLALLFDRYNNKAKKNLNKLAQ